MNRLIAVLALLLSGCANYQYNLIAPAELARHVGEQPAVVPIEPLIYTLQSYDNRLVLQIQNPTDAPVTLRGDESAVVDPAGESHPLRSQTIAAGSFIKLILPPIRPRVEPSGPTIGFGIGYGAGRAQDDPFFTPRYFSVHESGAEYWDWDGESTVRMQLVFEQAGRTFRHSLQFNRVKM